MRFDYACKSLTSDCVVSPLLLHVSLNPDDRENITQTKYSVLPTYPACAVQLYLFLKFYVLFYQCALVPSAARLLVTAFRFRRKSSRK
jgi:hypothetical protein